MVSRRILSAVRLPIPPQRLISAPKHRRRCSIHYPYQKIKPEFPDATKIKVFMQGTRKPAASDIGKPTEIGRFFKIKQREF